MANVAFKKGTQASLEKYLYSYLGTNPVPVEATEGTFYLTTDTNRLYIGKLISNADLPSGSPYTRYNGLVKAVPVNQGAIPVASVGDLPEPHAAIPGQFYYVVDGNILAVSSHGTWVQINPNTNDNDFLTEITTEVTGTAYTDSYRIDDDTHHTIDKTTEFVGADSFGVAVEQKYVEASVYMTGVDYYKNTGTAQDPTWVKDTTITSASAYNTSSDILYVRKGVKITLTPVSYSIAQSVSNGVGIITLSNNKNQTTSTAQIAAGSNAEIAAGINDVIVINAKDTKNTAVSFSPVTGTNAHGFDLTISAENEDHTDASVTTAAAGRLDPQIMIGQNGNVGRYFEGGIATLPVYTISEVNQKFSTFNAMHYKGIMTNNKIITNAEIGDVYKCSEDVTSITYKFLSDPEDSSTGTQKIVTVNAKAGDLVIFNSSTAEDDTTGAITTTGVTVEIVPSGDEIDTVVATGSYSESNTVVGYSIQNKAGISNPEDVAHIAVKGGNCLTAATVVTTDSNDVPIYTTTINHDTKTVTTTTSSTTEVTNPSNSGYLTITVPTLTFDDYGHVATVTNTVYQVSDTHIELANAYAIAQDTESGNAVNKLTVTNTVSDSATGMSSNTASANFGISSDSITLSTTTNGGKAYVVMDIVWGTF